MKQLNKYAGITTSIVKPYPKGDEGWRFNLASNKNTPEWYDGSTEDHLFGSQYLHEVYFKADPEYKGKYSVPVLWDKKLNTIVNNESLELLQDLQTAFDGLKDLPEELREITLYPEGSREDIDRIGEWMQRDLNTGVYKGTSYSPTENTPSMSTTPLTAPLAAGFARTQSDYEKNLPSVFAALNSLEKIASSNHGPYILGTTLTELDVRAYATLIRFDAIYVQHFKCNLGTIRHNYPVLNNWLKGLYWGHTGNAGGEGGEKVWRDTTELRHIKENYTKSQDYINPLAITPVGPWPVVEEGYERDWGKIQPGSVGMPEVLEREKGLK